MLEFTLKQNGKTFTSHPIDSQTITIGRGRENSIKLLDDEISRNHCRIELLEGSPYITDTSSNGTFLNDKPIKKSELHAGDTINIGGWSMKVEDSTFESTPRTVAGTVQPTNIIEFDVKKKKIVSKRLELLLHSKGKKRIKRTIALSEFSIGQHPDCDICIEDPYTSKEHCKIINGEDGIKLIDLASTNGTFFGGKKIDGVSIPDHGRFQIGRTSITYRTKKKSEPVGVSDEPSISGMIGPSREMRELFSLINRVGASNASTCITGESGTGKELAARALHDVSPRRRSPFVAVNCGAIPANIIESHLFGHERGSFTGAVDRSTGLIEQAEGGTLFLDEIGEMPLDLQTRLLRVLEERTLRRVGGKREIDVDFRLVCATNKNLRELVRDGLFREDLFFRIFVVPIELPPLNGRGKDILALAEHFIEKLKGDKHHLSLTRAAIEKLCEHGWPGNVRELKNCMERTILLSTDDIIDADDIKLLHNGSEEDEKPLKSRERNILSEALIACNGNITRTARKLKIARTTLQKKIKILSIEIPHKSIPKK